MHTAENSDMKWRKCKTCSKLAQILSVSVKVCGSGLVIFNSYHKSLFYKHQLQIQCAVIKQDLTLIRSQQHEITMSLCDWTEKGSLVSSSLTSIENDNISSKAWPISANDAPPTTGKNIYIKKKNKLSYYFVKKPSGFIAEQLKHFAIDHLEVDKGKLKAVASLWNWHFERQCTLEC